MAAESRNPSKEEIIQYAVQRASEEGIDPRAVVGLIQQESGFNPKAVGDGGKAVGVAQFWPETAKEVGVEDRTDPYQSIDGVITFLKKYSKDKGIKYALDLYRGNKSGPPIMPSVIAAGEKVLGSNGDTEAISGEPEEEGLSQYLDAISGGGGEEGADKEFLGQYLDAISGPELPAGPDTQPAVELNKTLSQVNAFNKAMHFVAALAEQEKKTTVLTVTDALRLPWDFANAVLSVSGLARNPVLLEVAKKAINGVDWDEFIKEEFGFDPQKAREEEGFFTAAIRLGIENFIQGYGLMKVLSTAAMAKLAANGGDITQLGNIYRYALSYTKNPTNALADLLGGAGLAVIEKGADYINGFANSISDFFGLKDRQARNIVSGATFALAALSVSPVSRTAAETSFAQKALGRPQGAAEISAIPTVEPIEKATGLKNLPPDTAPVQTPAGQKIATTLAPRAEQTFYPGADVQRASEEAAKVGSMLNIPLDNPSPEINLILKSMDDEAAAEVAQTVAKTQDEIKGIMFTNAEQIADRSNLVVQSVKNLYDKLEALETKYWSDVPLETTKVTPVNTAKEFELLPENSPLREAVIKRYSNIFKQTLDQQPGPEVYARELKELRTFIQNSVRGRNDSEAYLFSRLSKAITDDLLSAPAISKEFDRARKLTAFIHQMFDPPETAGQVNPLKTILDASKWGGDPKIVLNKLGEQVSSGKTGGFSDRIKLLDTFFEENPEVAKAINTSDLQAMKGALADATEALLAPHLPAGFALEEMKKEGGLISAQTIKKHFTNVANTITKFSEAKKPILKEISPDLFVKFENAAKVYRDAAGKLEEVAKRISPDASIIQKYPNAETLYGQLLDRYLETGDVAVHNIVFGTLKKYGVSPREVIIKDLVARAKKPEDFVALLDNPRYRSMIANNFTEEEIGRIMTIKDTVDRLTKKGVFPIKGIIKEDDPLGPLETAVTVNVGGLAGKATGTSLAMAYLFRRKMAAWIRATTFRSQSEVIMHALQDRNYFDSLMEMAKDRPNEIAARRYIMATKGLQQYEMELEEFEREQKREMASRYYLGGFKQTINQAPPAPQAALAPFNPYTGRHIAPPIE